jgi:hypothetical protein
LAIPAHDNDAERAARAGLELLDAIAKLGESPGARNWQHESGTPAKGIITG